MPVEIVGPRDSWPAEFRVIGTDLREILGALALRIDHIGSTAVPGLAAKDVIDVQVTVRSLEPWTTIPRTLADSGYIEVPDIAGDHRRAGGPEGEEHWRKRFFREPQGRRRAHIHVREDERPNQRYALLFRDYLRTHDEDAASYLAAKRDLAERFRDDRDAYSDAKDPVCDRLIEAAEVWAGAVAWAPGPSDA